MSNINELQPIQSLRPFTKFCCTIGNLPTSYMVSLTYEEQLLWLCDYIKNTVIPTINNNGEAVAELQGLYVQLKNYVNDYFTNLNVQDEINKKLDEMAENGTLDYIFNPYYEDFNKKINEFENTTNNNISKFENNVNSQLNSFIKTSHNPVAVSSISQMTDTSLIYVNTTNGNWYYYNTDTNQWTIGGIYQSYEESPSLKNNTEAINSITDKISSLNIYNYQMEKQNGYFSLSSGEIVENDEFFYTTEYIPIEEITNYIFGLYNYITKQYVNTINPIIIFYDNSKNFISGINTRDTFIPPTNAKFLRFSCQKVYDKGYPDYNTNNYAIMLSKSNTHSEIYQDYFNTIYKIKEKALPNTIKTNILTVKKNGTGDFTKLQDAINSITDNSEFNKYIINIYAGEYNIAEDFTQDQLNPSTNFAGIFVPDYCSIIGIGNRDNIIIYADLEQRHQYISTLNFKNTAYIENITVRGTNTRYALHDDLASKNLNYYERIVKNCKIIGIKNYYSVAYGAGTQDGAHWKFINTIFDASHSSPNNSNGLAFAVHNALNSKLNRFIEFINCRFITNNSNGSLLLKTLAYRTSSGLETSEEMLTYVTVIGNEFGSGNIGFKLVEENPTVYGKGCLYNVTGFSNKNDSYLIETTDEKDYSNRVNLI